MALPDAYLTVQEAEEFSLRVADLAAWSAADDDAKGRALIQASDELDTLLYEGLPYGDWLRGVRGAQARAFPRFVPYEPSQWMIGKQAVQGETWDLDSGRNPIVPEKVKLAAFLQALSILRDPARAARLREQYDGVASQSAGGQSEAYQGNAPQIVCLEAARLLQPYVLKSGRVV